MGTRRPMSRIANGNGRYYDSLGSSNGSASESEDSNGSVYSPRADSRSYLLNVRPENRTTFCNIISQLTEETQPCFETTLKARAVSEGCDAKFICMVTGYPEPEVTWYKDDAEMDRYCGLPKYEIIRNGKRHSLHIYKCSEEDAAIYQASARNNKGIVSCSGVLEVGTMTEYKIHQRWFAKLKRKAEVKMREIEQSRRKVKENLEEGERLRTLSPERIQRKRRFSSENKDTSPLSLDKEEVIKVHIPDPNSRLQEVKPNATEQAHNVVNGLTMVDTPQSEEVTTNGFAPHQNIDEHGKDFLAYVYETMEVMTKKPMPKESYAKKKKKEEESPSVPIVDSKREEPSLGSSPKKVESTGPTTRRSRFGKDNTKTSMEEKMEVQPAPVISNRRFANSSTSNKFSKTIVGNDSKKLKEVVVPPGKGADSSSTKQDLEQPKGEVSFSLKDMYFGDGVPLPVAEGKVASTFEKDSNTKTVKEPIKYERHAKISPQGQVKEVPKAAPRRSKEQKDQTVGSKQSTTLSAKTDVLAPESTLGNQKMQDTKPTCDTQQSRAVEKVPQPTSHSESASVLQITEQPLSKNDQSELLPTASLPAELSAIAVEAKSPILGEPEKITDEPLEKNNAKISSEDSSEAKARTETLQKLKHLEMEYMALQKAYGLLQQQLEHSQKEEQKKRELPVSSGALIHNPVINPEAQKNIDDKESMIKCPSSPVPVYMETEETLKLEEIPIVDTVMQDEQEGAPQMFTREVPSPRPLQSPVTFMECNAREGANVHNYQVDETNLEERNTLQTKTLQTETMVDAGEAHQPDEQILKPTEVTRGAIVPATPISSEVDMSEEVRHFQGMAAPKVEQASDSHRGVEVTLVGTTAGSSNETTSTSGMLDDVTPIEKEKSLTNPNAVLTGTSVDTGAQEMSHSKNILDTDLPEEILSEDVTASDNQSVATLLRDVKKALESGATIDITSSSDTSPSSAGSPMIIPPTEDYFEAESLSLAPEEEKNISGDNMAPEMKNIAKTPNIEPDALTFPEKYTEETVKDDHVSKQQGKQDHSLVTSLKNSLLKLLHMKTDEDDKQVTKDSNKVGGSRPDSPGDICSPEGSLSPSGSRKIFELVKDSDSTQSPVSMHSTSTSGKLTPMSEEDIVQNDDSLQTSPTVPRKTHKIFRKEVAQVESAPLSPVITKRNSKATLIEPLLSKDDLSLTSSTSRKIAAKMASDTDFASTLSVPSIVVGSLPAEKTLGSMFFDLHADSNRKWKSTENVSLIPSATPEELASGARRKIYLLKSKQLDDAETASTGSLTPPSKKETPNVSPGLSRKGSALLTSQSPPVERRSPGMARKMAMLEVPKIYEEAVEKDKSSEERFLQNKDSDSSRKEDVQPTETKKINDPYKAPQVIRKIRAEQFSDASGNLKLWCQFFNVLSDSCITWYKDEVPVARVKRCAGDESQVALAIVQASAKDCGVYQCTIENEYGTDSTDCLLSSEILSGFISKEEIEVGEEIEMTPMVFAKGLADSGYWGDKFFGRIVMEDAHVGNGFLRKSSRVKVIYGLEPMFESGKTSIIKIRNLITFGTKNESTLVEKNYEITIQDCKIQNTTREYCKIFASECKALPNFGQLLEVLPLNLIYRPANNIPYATIEDDLEGHFTKYCIQDITGKLHHKNISEIGQKCCTFQHWVYQWTNGNFLVTNLEGVGWKLTNIGIATKSKGYQGLKESCCPAVLEEFVSGHQCNNYCDMLDLKPLKAIEGLQPPSKPKGSKSPSMGRKTGSAQSSPQIQKKGLSSPQSSRKGGVSPKAIRKATELGDTQSASRTKGSDESTPAKPPAQK
ncbi:alpha-protein kinase 3 isoform X2 [Spea bombifrons]|uniref:alpha-protein kinase 3 isoform X2 n=1 Tax=Spea bombifrons TaxID=233779 RepID=UPI00234B50B5|nr:alpha-protein kinase 3 isoform X2 [Spea bombifrons]